MKFEYAHMLHYELHARVTIFKCSEALLPACCDRKQHDETVEQGEPRHTDGIGIPVMAKAVNNGECGQQDYHDVGKVDAPAGGLFILFWGWVVRNFFPYDCEQETQCIDPPCSDHQQSAYDMEASFFVFHHPILNKMSD